jgi:hypothetical protein
VKGPGSIFAALLLAAPVSAAEINVRAAGGQLDLSATAAPVADILDRISKQTGMKVVYEGAVPRQLVTVSLHGRTPAEAVEGVLEGLGLNYILVGDVSGTKVQTLMMAGSTAPTVATTSSPAGKSDRQLRGTPAAAPDEEPAEEPEAEEEPEPPPVIAPVNPTAATTPPGVVAPPGMPGAASPNGAPRVIGPQGIPTFPGSTSPGAGGPTFPGSPVAPQPFAPQPFGTQPPATTPAAPAVGAPEGSTPPP